MVSAQHNKGIDIALRLAEARPQESFSIVKSCGKQEELDLLLPQLKQLGNVTLHENTADMHKFYESCKLLLMPSRCPEGWGRTASEAQITGIPVLGSIQGQLPETIGKGG